MNKVTLIEDEDIAEDPANFLESNETTTDMKIFPCKRCRFSSASKRDLKVHDGKKENLSFG